jgi:hypothetical protein
MMALVAWVSANDSRGGGEQCGVLFMPKVLLVEVTLKLDTVVSSTRLVCKFGRNDSYVSRVAASATV